MLEIMLPNLVPVQAPVPAQTPAPVQTSLAPVQTLPAKPQRVRVQAPVQDEAPAPVVVNETPVVDTTLVVVVNDPVVVQHVAVQNVVPETPMEVEDEDTILERLFFKRFGRALPEKEKEKDDVDQIKFVIDLTEDTEEMEHDLTPLLVPVVKSEPIEAAEAAENITNVAKRRQERRELVKARKAVTAFGKSLRKTNVIPEKEAPEVSADSNVSADASVNPIESVEQTIAESEAAIAASEAAIAASDANRKEFAAEFGDTNLDEFD